MLLRFCPCVGTWRFLWWCILILWHVYFGDVWLISVVTVDESYICMLFEFWCDDVASISWICALFACIIDLIEIGRYKLVSESWSVLSGLVFFEFPICMRHVQKYYGYLLCCSVLSCGFERSGGEVGCFMFVWSGKGGIFDCRGSVGCCWC